tara:strand:- start:987 stop:1148 length:162 start_codon:yes stop_codon:yes gene_type:complete
MILIKSIPIKNKNTICRLKSAVINPIPATIIVKSPIKVFESEMSFFFKHVARN